MKNRFLSLILLSVSALSFAQRDDVYFDPSNEVVVTRKQPTYIEQQEAPAPGVNDYNAPPVARSGGSYDYDDYDYYYTSRIRRFQNSNAVASSYYSPYYSDPYYYDPSMYGGFGNSGFGNSGFGNSGFGGFNNNMFLVSPIGMGYNPFTCRPMWRPWGPTWISGSSWSGFGMSPFGYSGYSNFGHYSPMYNIGWGSPYMTGYQQGYYDAFIGNHSNNNNNNNVPRPRVDPLVYRPRVPMATNTIRPGTGVSNSQINRNNGLNNTINSERPANISPQREATSIPQDRVPNANNAPSRRPILIESETPANVRQPQIEQQRQPQMEQPQQRQPQMEQPQQRQPQMEQPQRRQPQMEQPQRRQPQMEQPQRRQPQMEQPQRRQPQMEQPQRRQPQMEQPQRRQPQMEQPQRRQPQMEQPQRQPQMEQPQRRAQEYQAPAPSNNGGGSSSPRQRGPR